MIDVGSPWGCLFCLIAVEGMSKNEELCWEHKTF